MWWKGNIRALLVGMKAGTATMENNMEVLQKIKNRTSKCPAITLLGIFPKKTKTLICKAICSPMFTAVLLTIGKIWKQPKCLSTNEWIKYIHNGVLLSHKKEWNLTICNNMDEPRGCYAKGYKSDRERQTHTVSFIHAV